jgi:hypothetical protein
VIIDAGKFMRTAESQSEEARRMAAIARQMRERAIEMRAEQRVIMLLKAHV